MRKYEKSIFSTVSSCDLQQIQFLLEKGVSVNVQDDNGNYLIHVAALANYPELMRLLLDNGANPNVRNKAGETPLMLAVKNGNSLLLDLLFKHSAEANLNDVFAMTSYLLQNERH